MNKIIMNENKEIRTDKEKSIYNFVLNKFLELLSSKKVILLIVIVNVVLILIIVYILCFKESVFVGNEDGTQFLENDIVIENTSINVETEIVKIKIHIAGEVKNSGIYELEEGARISDSIEKAGGITTDADLSKVNLAYQLSDGQKIIIPSIKNDYEGNYIIESSGENILQEENKKDSKININTASVSELITLPGVGSATAEKIINYRNENGSFKSIEDIKNVSGIGESKYNQLSGYIKIK